MKLRRLREGDVLDDGTTLVRGGELEPGVLRADARPYHTVYGSYGISVFAARDATVDEFGSAGAAGPVRHLYDLRPGNECPHTRVRVLTR